MYWRTTCIIITILDKVSSAAHTTRASRKNSQNGTPDLCDSESNFARIAAVHVRLVQLPAVPRHEW